jgi:hypothetical protein
VPGREPRRLRGGFIPKPVAHDWPAIRDASRLRGWSSLTRSPQAATEAERAADAARRDRSIALKNYHLKQVRGARACAGKYTDGNALPARAVCRA